MSKKCEIRPLSTLALSDLASLVVEAIGGTLMAQATFQVDSDEINIVMVEINSYLDNMGATSNIYEDLLKVILNSDALEASVRFTCMQMLLNESVQSLSTEVFPFSYYEKILQVIAAQGHGIRFLNMKGVWVKEDNMNFMHALIKNLPNLSRLSIPYIANDDLLKCIAHNSEKLKFLDVSGETDITDIGLEYLCLGVAKETLTVVDIGTLGEENICHTDVAFMITQLPNLINLLTYSFTGRALQFILDSINPEFKSKLLYLHDTDTKTATLDAIRRTCPNLEHIYLDSPAPGCLHLMQEMKLKRLKICKFSCPEVLQLLDRIGSFLVHLTVIKGAGNLDIGRLVRSCPNLIDLDFYLMDTLTYVYDKSFSQLEGLEILNSPLNTSCLRCFLCNTTTLKRIAVDQIAFNDEDLHRIVLEYDFKVLEDIWFTSAPLLTMAAVEILMERCPELQSIGQLSGWNLSPDDVFLLQGILKSGNSCLTLSPSTSFP